MFVVPSDASRSVQEALQELERRLRSLEKSHAGVADEIATSAQAVSNKAQEVAIKEAHKAAQWNPEFDVVRGGAGHVMGAAPDPGYHETNVRYLTSDGEFAPLLDGAIVSPDPGKGGTSLAQKTVCVNGSLSITGGLRADTIEGRIVHGRMVGCHAVASADQSIANSTVTALTFDTDVWDPYGFHNGTVNPSMFTVPAGLGGWYLVLAEARWEDIDDLDGYRSLRLEKNSNGTATINNIVSNTLVCQGSTGGDVVTNSLVVVVYLSAGDHVEAYAAQTSGSAINIKTVDGLYVGNTIHSPFVQMVRLGW